MRGASARALSRLLTNTSEGKCYCFGKERDQSLLPLQSKGEEEGMGRGKVRLWRSRLCLIPPSPQTAAADPSTLAAAPSSDSSCSLQTSALGSCLLCKGGCYLQNQGLSAEPHRAGLNPYKISSDFALDQFTDCKDV